MHCLILANEHDSFPRCLRPMKGRAVLDYLLDDIFLQKEIIKITVLVSDESSYLVKKHLASAYPRREIEVIKGNIESISLAKDDALILKASVHTSLKLQDFIRYFRQFKTVTRATYDKESPKEIPFIIIPKNSQSSEIHTYNCGSGYLFD